MTVSVTLTYDQAVLVRAILDDAVRFTDMDIAGADLQNVDAVMDVLADAIESADTAATA